MKPVTAMLILAAVIIALAGCDDNPTEQTTPRSPAVGPDRPAAPIDTAARAAAPRSAPDAVAAPAEAPTPSEPAVTPDEQAGRNLTKARQDLADIAQGAKSLEALLLSATVEGAEDGDAQADPPQQAPPAGHDTDAKETTDDHRQ